MLLSTHTHVLYLNHDPLHAPVNQTPRQNHLLTRTPTNHSPEKPTSPTRRSSSNESPFEFDLTREFGAARFDISRQNRDITYAPKSGEDPGSLPALRYLMAGGFLSGIIAGFKVQDSGVSDCMRLCLGLF